jgi:hypothetical protein
VDLRLQRCRPIAVGSVHGASVRRSNTTAALT